MKVEKGRIGSFFLLIGLVLLVIFFVTDQAKPPSWGYLIAGGIALILGGHLWWRDLKPGPEESGRFRSWRRMRQKRAERRERKRRKKEEREAAQQ